MKSLTCLIFLVFLVFTEGKVDSSIGKCPTDKQAGSSCPAGWNEKGTKCYLFQTFPLATYDNSISECLKKGANALRVSTLEENKFITDWLNRNAINKTMLWYTSGRMNPARFGSYEWNGHPVGERTFSNDFSTLWVDSVPDATQAPTWPPDNKYITYKYIGNKWGFSLQPGDVERSFICEVNKNIAYQNILTGRDITYGQDDANNVLRGPCINKQPDNAWIFLPFRQDFVESQPVVVSFFCSNYGNPAPIVRWYRVSSNFDRILIDPLTDTSGRYSQTGDRLDIYDPKPATDSDGFQCEVSNKFGKVLSRVAYVTFQMVDQFEKTDRKLIVGNANEGKVLDCKPPRFSPPDSLRFYYLMKRPGSDVADIVVESLRKNLFVSQVKGLLAFSDTSTIDTGVYICMITPSYKFAYGIAQKSPSIPFDVVEANKPIQKPKIIDEFPAVTPSSPLRGDDVRIECFAYGSMRSTGLEYTWRKINGNIPGSAVLQEYNRVLFIPNIQTSDSGQYECSVIDAFGTKAVPKAITINVQSKPYFVQAPQDVHADFGNKVEIVCQASGIPEVTVVWYRNTEPMANLLRDGTIDSTKYNITEGLVNQAKITISNVGKGDEAMFGCVAKNNFGVEISYSQLRVLQFAPNFNKYPLLPTEGITGGVVTIVCSPEGSPQPTITWLKDGAAIATGEISIDTSTGTRNCNKFCKLANNNLYITNLGTADSGSYTCVGKNPLGEAQSTSYLNVATSMSFTVTPKSRQVQVNTSVVLPCRVNAPSYLDINYQWFFEGVEILFDRLDLDARRYEMTKFTRPYDRYYGTLRVSNIQFDFDGNFTCRAQTSINVAETWAYIRVAGPPGPCAGVEADPLPGDKGTNVNWVEGANHQNAITGYVLQVQTDNEYNPWNDAAVLNISEVIMLPAPGGQPSIRRQYKLMNLIANTAYRVRVISINGYGPGDKSIPSSWFTTQSLPPNKIIQKVTGGGGKVQTLVVRWKPLDAADERAPGFKYRIHLKQPDEKEFRITVLTNTSFRTLEPTTNNEVNETMYQYTYTLTKQPGYRPYNVAVSTINDNGVGPMSDVATIYSAPIVPTSAPQDVYAGAFNDSALRVEWKPLVLTPEEGRISGYRIVYWQRKVTCVSPLANTERYALGQRQTVIGEENNGTVIGLEPDTYYCIAVQVFNEAGDGPESGFYEQTTFKKAPQDFPTLVMVNSTDVPHQVKVHWVGVQAKPDEESLDGYQIRYWLAGSPYKETFVDIDTGLKTDGLINGLKFDTRYNLRVYAYSRGGVGTLSSPMVQFTLTTSKCVAGTTWDGPDVRYVFICSGSSVYISYALLLFSLLFAHFLRT